MQWMRRDMPMKSPESKEAGMNDKGFELETPNSRLRILMLEDDPADAELIERELSKGGKPFISRRVETREGFIREIEDLAPDLILADHRLPSFDGLSALEIAREKCPDVPFIFVTGAMGEERAIETFKRGATDYVLKDRLARLVPAVQRALHEAEEHTKRKAAEEELRQRVEELERFRKATIQREFKMKELMDRMKELEEKGKGAGKQRIRGTREEMNDGK